MPRAIALLAALALLAAPAAAVAFLVNPGLEGWADVAVLDDRDARGGALAVSTGGDATATGACVVTVFRACVTGVAVSTSGTATATNRCQQLNGQVCTGVAVGQQHASGRVAASPGGTAVGEVAVAHGAAQGSLAAASLEGDAAAPVAVARGDSGGTHAASLDGDAASRGGVAATAGPGTASCEGQLACAAASATGAATCAMPATQSTFHLHAACAAASVEGAATCSAEQPRRPFHLSLVTVNLCAAASGTGPATGGVAVAGTGDAHAQASCATVFAQAVPGACTGVAVSATGDSEGDRAAVSLAGRAQGPVAVGGCDLAGVCLQA